MKLLALILSLSFLIITHEFGHYCFARLFKIRVEQFYLFFNWGLSLVRMKKFDGKWHFDYFSSKAPEEWNEHPEATEWGIGWLPLGGFCSIAGMVDETKTADDLPSEPQPWEYRSKPAWQRLFVITGGVLVNFISALVIYSAIMFTWGEEYLPLENCKYGIHYSEAARELGFQNGDKIISVGGEIPRDLSDFTLKVYLDNPQNVVVNRNGSIDTISIPENYAKNNLKKISQQAFCIFEFPFVIDSVLPGMPAANAKLCKGDSLVAIDDTISPLFYSAQEYFTYQGGETVQLSFLREDSLYSSPVKISNEGKIGVIPSNPYNFISKETIHYSFFSSIPRGIAMGFDQLKFYVKQFKLIFSSEGVKQLGGFGTMGKLFPKSWDWHSFWNTTALFAIILAFMNIIPIPGLDGGYFLFILVEMITRKKPGDKFLTYANTIGLALILLLALYANGMDIVRYFFQ